MILIDFIFTNFWTFLGFLILFGVATNFIIQLAKYFFDFAKVCIRGQPLNKNYYFNKPEEEAITENAPEVEEEADKKKEE